MASAQTSEKSTPQRKILHEEFAAEYIHPFLLICSSVIHTLRTWAFAISSGLLNALIDVIWETMSAIWCAVFGTCGNLIDLISACCRQIFLSSLDLTRQTLSVPIVGFILVTWEVCSWAAWLVWFVLATVFNWTTAILYAFFSFPAALERFMENTVWALCIRIWQLFIDSIFGVVMSVIAFYLFSSGSIACEQACRACGTVLETVERRIGQLQFGRVLVLVWLVAWLMHNLGSFVFASLLLGALAMFIVMQAEEDEVASDVGTSGPATQSWQFGTSDVCDVSSSGFARRTTL